MSYDLIGVTSSPFLATSVLRQIADEHGDEFPEAAAVIKNSFYVDDCLTGTLTLAEAQSLREGLNAILARGQMQLRKWRSNSQQLLSTMPNELKEKDESTLNISLGDCQKTLGLHWNTITDSLHVQTPTLDSIVHPTKREVSSAMAKTFDLLGWFAPATVTIKILMQKIWISKTNGDDPIPQELLPTWEVWSSSITALTDFAIPRRLTTSTSAVISTQLHGFADASMAAYEGVVYLRYLHQDTSVMVTLLAAKTKVAPVKPTTIPHLELNGALLLSRLLSYLAQTMDIPVCQVYAWSDSAVVLGWLNTAPAKLKVYVANRVTQTCSLIPAEQWRYVNTQQNLADFASRGLQRQQLLDCSLWWQGPEWLTASPKDWPKHPDINLGREIPELRAKVLMAIISFDTDLWEQYSSLDHLVRITAWLRRFTSNCMTKLFRRVGTPLWAAWWAFKERNLQPRLIQTNLSPPTPCCFTNPSSLPMLQNFRHCRRDNLLPERPSSYSSILYWAKMDF